MEHQDFGNYLRKERELRQITLSEVASATKIPVPMLVNLEEGVWDKLPAGVFVKGFIRSYANHIGLPAEETCGQFNKIIEEQENIRNQQPEPVGDSTTVLDGKRRFGVALFMLILLIIATITISILWRSGASADTHAEMSVDNYSSLRIG